MTKKEKPNLKQIPGVDEILNKHYIKPLVGTYSRKMVVETIRKVLSDIREELKKHNNSFYDKFETFSDENMEEKIKDKLEKEANVGIKKVINATGIILSTNLGRAVLAKEAVEALSKLDGYSSLEVDLETGDRGRRWIQIEKLLCLITGAEAATVVNNNAAATLLILNTLAKGKEVIVSRGELIEIGGSFRIPDVMAQSGAILVEVGTTNRTHLRDYEKAINENTALLLHVHTSNYRIKGFTSSVPVKDLVKLGKKHNLPVVDDLGSGALIDFSKYGFNNEPTVQASINDGADIVCFSADKLIGGPQGGIIVGRKEYVERIRKNPLSRALRIGKLTTSVLEATLRLFLDEEHLVENLPLLKMLTLDKEKLQKRANKIVDGINKKAKNLEVKIEDDFSQMGGGSLPEENIPSKVVSLKSKGISTEELARKLRFFETPILTRIRDDKVILDLRTIQEGEEEKIVKALR